MAHNDECFGCGKENAAGLGLRFARDEAPGEDRRDRVAADWVPQVEHRGAPGFLHGGLAATALDEAMASVGVVCDGEPWVTGTLEVRYRRPVPLDGQVLRVEAWRAEAEPVHDATRPRRRYRLHGRIRLADGTVAVESSGLFLALAGTFADRP